MGSKAPIRLVRPGERRETSLPKTIRVLGHDYAVVVDDCMGQGDSSPACVEPQKLRITIDGMIPESLQQEGLVHEIIEVVNHHLELGLPHAAISALGESLFQVLRDNNLGIGKNNLGAR